MPDVREVLESSLGATHTIERELGGGGMSRVFVAEERALRRKVVVKTLSPDMSAGVSFERFKREIMLAAQLQHPHIAPLLAAGEAEGVPYYTMPFIEGQSLRERLARGPIPLDEALTILRGIAQALEYAHVRQVVHRDIKPENVLLSHGVAVVTDFGIARAVTAAARTDSHTTLTALGSVIGTPAYMAPEQAAGEAVDHRADLYAWGVIAYEMLSGAHPFAGSGSARAFLAAHIAQTPAPLAQQRADLPAALTLLVDQCLAKNPADRPGDAGAVLARLAIAAPGAKRTRGIVAVVSVAVVVIALLTWLFVRSEQHRWARETAIPLAKQLQAHDLSLAAYRVLRRANAIVPADTQIANLLARSRISASVASSPSGARVAIQDYLTPDSAWHELGTTPIAKVDLPSGYFRWKIVKAGVGADTTAHRAFATMSFPLDSEVAAPPRMAFAEGGNWADMIAFVGWVGPFALPSFYIDRFEVTNREFQEFVDKGGYEDSTYWREKFVDGGRDLSREQAMLRFRDRTGRPGPSTWQGGHYPEGQGDYPVSGVSWYEASAYAAFVGKSLPAFAQWYAAAPGSAGRYITLMSNISRTSASPVGRFKGLGPLGTYDMAGNVREWTRNALGADRRFILGGSWRSLSYLYADPEALSPFDRSPENGFRCVKNVVPLPPAVYQPVKPIERDFAKVHPASDAVFRAYTVMYDYDRTPLNAKLESVQETQDWRKEKVTYDTPYGERTAAYVFLPKNVRPPYQALVFFPSARVLDLSDSRNLGDTSFFDFVVQSGRAVIYPVYQDTYERRAHNSLPGNAGEKELYIQRSKDVARAIDYLQSRPDIAHDDIGYLGVSMGSAEGVVYATLAQDRLRAVVFLDGGYFLAPPAPGTDQADFAPRLKKPVLMVNGRYDFTFSLERAQEPLFRMLGTPAADKQHVVFETPHDVRQDRPALISVVLGYLDKYLGRVR
ncbi:MAG TPA: protein kinase [Gemmatimonadaceae bacterium]|nr:protein kinase [Gemmatimonadaceae bacterium]